MQNKNNKTVSELVNLILDIQDKKGNRPHAYAYALGCIQAILDWEVKGFNSRIKLQEVINNQYESYEAELKALEVVTA